MNYKNIIALVSLFSMSCVNTKEPSRVLNTYFLEDFNYYSSKVGLKPLEFYGVEDSNLFLRIWVDHCTGKSEGFFIQRIYGEWSGKKLIWESVYPTTKTLTPKGCEKFSRLKTWDDIGNSLLESKVLHLKDMHSLEKLENAPVFFGGCSIIFVELKTSDGYRNYYYNFDAGRKLNDFSDPVVLESFEYAANIRDILLHCFNPETKLDPIRKGSVAPKL